MAGHYATHEEPGLSYDSLEEFATSMQRVSKEVAQMLAQGMELEDVVICARPGYQSVAKLSDLGEEAQWGQRHFEKVVGEHLLEVQAQMVAWLRPQAGWRVKLVTSDGKRVLVAVAGLRGESAFEWRQTTEEEEDGVLKDLLQQAQSESTRRLLGRWD